MMINVGDDIKLLFFFEAFLGKGRLLRLLDAYRTMLASSVDFLTCLCL